MTNHALESSPFDQGRFDLLPDAIREHYSYRTEQSYVH